MAEAANFFGFSFGNTELTTRLREPGCRKITLKNQLRRPEFTSGSCSTKNGSRLTPLHNPQRLVEHAASQKGKRNPPIVCDLHWPWFLSSCSHVHYNPNKLLSTKFDEDCGRRESTEPLFVREALSFLGRRPWDHRNPRGSENRVHLCWELFLRRAHSRDNGSEGNRDCGR